MARGDQPVRRPTAAGDLLHREQPDRAVDAGAEQSAVVSLPTRRAGYGIPGITIDGTDPGRSAAAFTWAAERARAGSARRSSSW